MQSIGSQLNQERKLINHLVKINRSRIQRVLLLTFIATHPELQHDFSDETIQNLQISINDFKPKQQVLTEIEYYYRLRSLAVLGNNNEELQNHLNSLVDPILQQK